MNNVRRVAQKLPVLVFDIHDAFTVVSVSLLPSFLPSFHCCLQTTVANSCSCRYPTLMPADVWQGYIALPTASLLRSLQKFHSDSETLADITREIHLIFGKNTLLLCMQNNAGCKGITASMFRNCEMQAGLAYVVFVAVALCSPDMVMYAFNYVSPLPKGDPAPLWSA